VWGDPKSLESRRILRGILGRIGRRGRSGGVAWQLNSSTIVTRRELSYALLEALERRRSAFLKYRAAQHRRESGKPPPETSNSKDRQALTRTATIYCYARNSQKWNSTFHFMEFLSKIPVQ
jgi:hypothetical protein